MKSLCPFCMTEAVEDRKCAKCGTTIPRPCDIGAPSRKPVMLGKPAEFAPKVKERKAVA